MNYTITTTLSAQLYNFLKKEASAKKVTRKRIIEEALKKYQKEQLKEEIKNGLIERQEEYQDIQNEFSRVQASSLNF